MESEIKALKQKIVDVMTGVMSEVFQSHADLQESSIQTHLFEPKNKKSPEQIQENLKSLEETLKKLDLFCQTAKKQLEKAIDKTKGS